MIRFGGAIVVYRLRTRTRTKNFANPSPTSLRAECSRKAGRETAVVASLAPSTADKFNMILSAE